MRIFEHIADLREAPGPVVLAIGVFDGLHLGHRAVLNRALADASALRGTPVAATFHPHPAKTLRPEHAPRLLTSLPHKQRLIAELGFQHLLVIRFDADFAATPPTEFLHALTTSCQPLGGIVVGCGWTFGKARAGTVDLIRQYGASHGFQAVEIPAVAIDGSPVSSTRIRRAVEQGDFTTASRCLGRPYSILGTVERGRQIGRTLGFPTANLRAHNEQFPPDGVYAVDVLLPDHTTHRAVANIGFRPTTASPSERTLEVHIPALHRDLYDLDLEITFLQFLRPEQKFPSLDHLKSQISQDITRALTLGQS